jgi:hypothetical protein
MVFMILSGFMIVTAEVSNYYSRKHDKVKGEEGKKESRHNENQGISQDLDFTNLIEDSESRWDK